ncbi:MAG: ABC transporter ATP-binding protein [Chitinophagaceae bacterium]|nr:ABC transporter ATP-binding protein [Chitinophagaceae bacterium]MCF8289721.1 ABC transporter ATP-binding protein [Chitinophagaceae bacterium]MCF8422195.1 ABC transporter ATP-binding protein [Chitinophagaceae bacterium]
MQPKLLVAKDIWKQYGTVPVLKGVSLELSKGELVSIVGPSGAGKSTLLHIVSSLEKADKGQVFYEGVALDKLNNQQLAHFRNTRIGFVFQFHHLLPEFTAIENIAIPGWIGKQDKKTVAKKALELLDYLGLADKQDKKPHQLSGGEQQRIAVARALINQPAIIFADEPTGNLDSENAHAMHELFLRLKKELNQSFLIVTHNESLAALCDRTLTMKDGLFV